MFCEFQSLGQQAGGARGYTTHFGPPKRKKKNTHCFGLKAHRAAKTYSFEECELLKSFEITAKISNFEIPIQKGILCRGSVFMFCMDRTFCVISVMDTSENGQKEEEMRTKKNVGSSGIVHGSRACVCINFLGNGRFKNRCRRFRIFVFVNSFMFEVRRIGHTASGEREGQFTRTYHRFHSWSMWFGSQLYL